MILRAWHPRWQQELQHIHLYCVPCTLAVKELLNAAALPQE